MGELLTEKIHFLMLTYADGSDMDFKNYNQTKRQTQLWSH